MGRKGQWKTGVFDVTSDCPLPLVVLCCPCTAVGQIAHKVGKPKDLWCVGCFVGGIATACVGGCLAVGFLREQLRQSLDIRGGVGEDYALSCFCTYCTLCQMKRELEGLALDSKRPTAGRGEIPKQQQMAQESSDDARRRERGQQGGASE